MRVFFSIAVLLIFININSQTVVTKGIIDIFIDENNTELNFKDTYEALYDLDPDLRINTFHDSIKWKHPSNYLNLEFVDYTSGIYHFKIDLHNSGVRFWGAFTQPSNTKIGFKMRNSTYGEVDGSPVKYRILTFNIKYDCSGAGSLYVKRITENPYIPATEEDWIPID